ncbi:MAG TPA: phenylalanine--tRNA ligase subunit beta [Thermoanaerobaculia bacterium]|nr:phenylalanine--tRNA ligase subunit beta [Thermoanaerobaculia bacterium]
MKLSREWLSDYIDLGDLSDDDLARRMTEVGHAVEAIEKHGADTVFDAEITTNRIDAMSHLGMARELAAALGRELLPPTIDAMRPRIAAPNANPGATIAIQAPEMCRRFSGLVIRGVNIKPSPERLRRRLEAVGLRPISNVVDATNYVMLALGHPLHAYDLDRLAKATIIVRAGAVGESMRTLDGEMRRIDREAVVIADGARAIGLGGIMGGAESEISDSTRNVLIECAWFTPGVIRRTARRLGMKTDASYRFERSVDPNDTLAVVDLAASLIVENAGGSREPFIDVVAVETKPKSIGLRRAKLLEQTDNVVGMLEAIALFRRLGFGVEETGDGISVVVPTYRGDIFEEMDLVEEVIRFHGIDKFPASLPRLTTGDIRIDTIAEAEDSIRDILSGCGGAEVVSYAFIHSAHNAIFSAENAVAVTNALTENVAAMRLTLLPGLLENLVYNRSYGTRDGALFEVGRTYHKVSEGVREWRRAALVMFGSIGLHWGDPKRPVDFFDIKGIIEQIAAKFHVGLTFSVSDAEWLRKGKRAVARHGDRVIATAGFLAGEVLQRFGIKGDVAVAEIDIEALLESTGKWSMAPVAHVPGVPMVLGLTHGRELEYQRIIDTIRSLEIPHLHEVGLRDRFVPDGEENQVKTTLGMWYQAFDRSLTQDEVAELHGRLAARVASLLPVKVLS